LSGCFQITSEGLKKLVQIKQLTSLRINECSQITDEGLKEVAKLQHLNSVHVGGAFSKITDAAKTELKKALPNCKINR